MADLAALIEQHQQVGGHGAAGPRCRACGTTWSPDHLAQALAAEGIGDTAQAGREALRAAAKAARDAERGGYLFLDGNHERVPWEAVARWLDGQAGPVADPR